MYLLLSHRLGAVTLSLNLVAFLETGLFHLVTTSQVGGFDRLARFDRGVLDLELIDGRGGIVPVL